jgi:hypothetical protein
MAGQPSRRVEMKGSLGRGEEDGRNRMGVVARLAAEIAVDTSSALVAALSVSPVVTIVDRAIVFNAAGRMVSRVAQAMLVPIEIGMRMNWTFWSRDLEFRLRDVIAD